MYWSFVPRGGPGNFPGATTFVEGRASSADVADVELDDAVLLLVVRVVVRQRELLGAEDVGLHGGVCGTLSGGLAVRHDVVHHVVAGCGHLRLGEVMGADRVAARTGACLGRHGLDERDAGDGFGHRASRLLHDLGHGDLECRERLGLVVGGDLPGGGGRRGAACGHASHLPFGRSLG
jgi:hypothetical protein